jgi:hypothetical protein
VAHPNSSTINNLALNENYQKECEVFTLKTRSVLSLGEFLDKLGLSDLLASQTAIITSLVVFNKNLNFFMSFAFPRNLRQLPLTNIFFQYLCIRRGSCFICWT